MTETLSLAEIEALAREAHAGQTDKAGRPYAEHLAAVAHGVRARGGSDEQIAAGWLHDAVEDDRLCVTALRQIKASGLAAVARHVTPEAIDSGYPVAGLRQAIATTRPELVVLIARPRSFLSAMFHRSVTSRLLDSCPVPVLLLPARGD